MLGFIREEAGDRKRGGATVSWGYGVWPIDQK